MGFVFGYGRLVQPQYHVAVGVAKGLWLGWLWKQTLVSNGLLAGGEELSFDTLI